MIIFTEYKKGIVFCGFKFYTLIKSLPKTPRSFYVRDWLNHLQVELRAIAKLFFNRNSSVFSIRQIRHVHIYSRLVHSDYFLIVRVRDTYPHNTF